MTALTKERFLREIGRHKMTVVCEDGIYRHVRFRRPSTGCMGFDLITWPGTLCYTGDMGTYVFKRLEDMFQFFRKPNLDRIDFSYWAEKVESYDRDGVQRFSLDVFREKVTDTFKNFADDMEEAERAALWQRVEEEVLRDPGGYDLDEATAFRLALEFEHEGRSVFPDFWERNCREFTLRFLWCCYAMAWGIQQYDAARGRPGEFFTEEPDHCLDEA